MQTGCFPECTAGYLETDDGAKIYYEDRGEGSPIVLVHGWLCSSKFWRRNVPALAEEFRVVTIDLRGHGNSSKSLTGHTIPENARDVWEIIKHLDLRQAVLAGWSLGGPVVLSCYQQFKREQRLNGLGLIDTTPFPFSTAGWNSHVLRDFNYDRLNATYLALAADQKRFAAEFATKMFHDAPKSADVEWIVAEMLKTPPWIAEAIYSSYVMSDFASTLPSVDLPVIVFAGDSGVFCKGVEMGKALAGLAPHSRFEPFDNAGHILFYEQPQKFNAALADFVKSLNPQHSSLRSRD